MNRLELLDGGVEPDGPFSAGEPLPFRLPRGRHGIPSNIVLEHQRLRLIAAMAEALAEQGYATVTTTHVSGRAGVSSATFYKHFGNLWDCVLAAYVWSADRLCEEIESAVEARGADADPLSTGIAAALTFLAAQPAIAQLLGAQPPLEASAVIAARRILISRLAAMLRRAPGRRAPGEQPAGLDERLIDATLAFLYSRVRAGEAKRLPELAPELVAILERGPGGV
ncbi:MAG TPA: TetR/AcrR family transcriptional regulator [Solirubrobacterales bacterium]|nr:TetR/AcrR family transcriptional regulator [Solirubrobacterales bacterium]